MAPIGAILASMTSVQLGSALSVPLFSTFGVAGTTWLRLTAAALALMLLVRPRVPERADLLASGALGVVMAANAVAFSGATDRIPLGVTVAVEFCGPASLAALRASQAAAARLIWPLCALAGVVILTRPWAIGGADAARTWTGLGFAAIAGLGWAGYILLPAHVGRRTKGLNGLAVALAAAAVVSAPLGLPQVWPRLRRAVPGLATPAGVPAPVPGAGIVGTVSSTVLGALAVVTLAALLVPLAAYALEMVALRRLDDGVFGVWMALEPAIGASVGAVLLGQHVGRWQLPGFALVVVAGVGAAWAARSAAATRRGAG